LNNLSSFSNIRTHSTYDSKLEIVMKQSELDSMSLDELFMLHEQLTATLEARITAERKALKDRLRTIGSPTGRAQDI